ARSRRSPGQAEHPLRDDVPLHLARAREDACGAVVEVRPNETAARDRVRAALQGAAHAEDVHHGVVDALAHLAPVELDEGALRPERRAAGEARERAPVVEL